MKNQNKSTGVALRVFHKKSDLQNYEGTYYLHKKGSIYPDTYNNVCSVFEAKKRLAKTFSLDVKDVEADITKENIHFYYEFMSDEAQKRKENETK